MKINRMTILFITHSSEMQGSGQALLNITEHLLNMGIDIYIVLPKTKGKLYDIIVERQIKHFDIPIVLCIWPKLQTPRDYIILPFRIFKNLLKSWFSFILLKKLIRKIKPEIIHTNIGVVNIGHFLAKRFKVPHVWHIREFQDLDFGWKTFPTKILFLKMLHNNNNYPVAITKEVYKYHNLNSNKNAIVIYDGVIESDIIPEIINDKKKYFLFVGNLSEGKGIKDAIEAFTSIAKKHSDFQFWIAGSCISTYQNELNKLVFDSNCQEQIKFLGFRTDVYSLMSEATALIVASKNEGFGFITTEAMYNGCLVVGRDTAGTKEQFDNGLKMHNTEIGLRFNTQNELISIMESLCKNGTNNYLSMIIKAQETVVTLYSTKLNADKIYNLYTEIITKNGETKKS